MTPIERLREAVDVPVDDVTVSRTDLAAVLSHLDTVVAACYQEIPQGVMATMSGFACLLCGWDADPSMPETHEPSCPLFGGDDA